MSFVHFSPGWRSQTLHAKTARCEQHGARNIDDQLKPGIELLRSFAISREKNSSTVDRRMLLHCPAGGCDINKEHQCSSDTTSCGTGSPSFAVSLSPRFLGGNLNGSGQILSTICTHSDAKDRTIEKQRSLDVARLSSHRRRTALLNFDEIISKTMDPAYVVYTFQSPRARLTIDEKLREVINQETAETDWIGSKLMLGTGAEEW